jgi:hypothetical protein
LSNTTLLSRVKGKLSEYGYGKTTLLATSFCCDEVSKPLQDDFCSVYGSNFNMGGLAGFAFGGVTSFGAMASHIPDGGSCLVVYGPHVGVDSMGKVGTVDRRGKKSGGSCCGSANAAAGYVAQQLEQGACQPCLPTDCLDAEQMFVNSMLLPHGQRLTQATDKSVELPLVLFDIQKELMHKIVERGCNKVGKEGTVAMLGGIQINTPEGMWDYFLPLEFEIRNNKGELIANLLWD